MLNKNTKNKRKNIVKIILIGIIILLVLTFPKTLFATNSQTANNTKTIETMQINNIESNSIIEDEATLSDTIKNLILTINSEGMTKQLLSETIDLYRKTSAQYTNNEIAVIIEDNREELVTNGVPNNEIDNVVKLLKNIDTKQLNKVLDTINIDEISTQIEQGKSLQDIIKDITNSLSATEKVGLVIDILLSAHVIKTILTAILVLFIYRTLLRCVIYKKAGKRAWAPFIPIYRNVVMLKICGMSPWWLLLLLVPIIGWAFLWVVSVASKFMLAESFGKGAGFGIGLWLLAPIFETILVFSRKTKYIGFEENEE